MKSLTNLNGFFEGLCGECLRFFDGVADISLFNFMMFCHRDNYSGRDLYQ